VVTSQWSSRTPGFLPKTWLSRFGAKRLIAIRKNQIPGPSAPGQSNTFSDGILRKPPYLVRTKSENNATSDSPTFCSQMERFVNLAAPAPASAFTFSYNLTQNLNNLNQILRNFMWIRAHFNSGDFLKHIKHVGT
jgi:hypothetical protein